MIITRTPFRISFFGGGTDYPDWYNNNPGAVISTTINKYCYITCRQLPPFFDYKYRIRYHKKEETKNIQEITHPSVRECLKYTKTTQGLEIVHHADLPARSGLGSSSTFTVGMLHALNALNGKMISKRQLALDAIHVEQNIIKENVGSQDQTNAAFGGFNHIEFNKRRKITISPIILSKIKQNTLSSHLMLFFTGFSRTASDISKHQIAAIKKNKIDMTHSYKLVEEAQKILNRKNFIKDFGNLLNEQWNMKKSYTKKITNKEIDYIYNTGIKAGAYGGKLLGAGGGGFILFVADPKHHNSLKNKLKKLLYVPINLESLGSQVVYYSNADI
jgi:D-glycero-alpha-D-manno-heptose-7-phosphate kinase